MKLSVIIEALLLICLLTDQCLTKPMGRLSVKVYRGPNRSFGSKPYATWGYYVLLPSDGSSQRESK